MCDWLVMFACFVLGWVGCSCWAAIRAGLTHGSRHANRSITRKYFGLLIATCLLASNGCNTTATPRSGPSKLTTPQQIAAVQKPATEAVVYVNKALALVEDIQAGKVAMTMEALAPIHEQLVQAKAATEEVSHALPEAEKTATADAKTATHQAAEIVELKKDDPIKTTFTWVGYGAFFSGLALVLGSFFIPSLFKFIWLRTAGAGLIVFGLLTLTVVHVLTLIYWVCGGVLLAAAVAGGFWLWTHRSAVKAKLKDDANWLPKPPAGGT